MLVLDYFMPLFLLQNFWNFQTDYNSSPSSSSSSSSTSAEATSRKQVSCNLPKKQSELNSFLWRVRRKPPVYMFGTIHVPYTRVWDWIPENAKRAFENSENIFFELDLTDPVTIQTLSACQRLPADEKLADLIPQELYQRLQRHLQYIKLTLPSWLSPEQRGGGLYADYLFQAMTGDWQHKRPVWVMLMLNTLTRLDVQARGTPVLDLYLAREAQRLSKNTGAVERVDEQCRPLNRLNISQVIFALNHTLSQHERIRAGLCLPPYTTDDLIHHYNCGDLTSVVFQRDSQLLTPPLPPLAEALTDVPQPPSSSSSASGQTKHSSPRWLRGAALSRANSLGLANMVDVGGNRSGAELWDSGVVTRVHSIDDYFREQLIYVRNERMANRVMELIEKHPEKSFFFAFGAGHFIGNNTVLDIMTRNNYEIKRIKPSRTIQSKRKSRGLRHGGISSSTSRKSRRGESKVEATRLVYDGGNWIEQHLTYSSYSELVEQDKEERIGEQGDRSSKEERRRRRRRKRRKKNRNFNDLWIRLDASSIESYFESSRTFFSSPPASNHGGGGVTQGQTPSSSSLNLSLSSQYQSIVAFITTTIITTILTSCQGLLAPVRSVH